jgi:catechol 2,3-dioxygenase-like lactoylglutathione lyase family enzyme
MRVRDRRRALAFYGLLFEQLGVVLEAEGRTWTSFVSGENKMGDWFAFTEDPLMSAGPGRVAFAAMSRHEVDRVAGVLDAIGAREIEGPSEAYGPNYYAVFFEDPDGNKLEVCHVTFEE